MASLAIFSSSGVRYALYPAYLFSPDKSLWCCQRHTNVYPYGWWHHRAYVCLLIVLLVHLFCYVSALTLLVILCFFSVGASSWPHIPSSEEGHNCKVYFVYQFIYPQQQIDFWKLSSDHRIWVEHTQPAPRAGLTGRPMGRGVANSSAASMP